MINYIQGDLFQAKETVLIHGCNCFNIMGGGVAFYVSKYYPEAYKKDCETKKGDSNKLGKFTSWEGNHYFYPNQKIVIVNAYTQYSTGNKAFDYGAFEIFLQNFKKYPFYDLSISMPKIGSGLAGGDWDKISNLIEYYWKDKEVNVYYL